MWVRHTLLRKTNVFIKFIIMNGKKMLLVYLGVVAAFVLGITMFGWGAPLTESSQDDVKAVVGLLEKTDTTNSKVENLAFSPVEEMPDSNGNMLDVQTVKYDLVSDSVTTNHFAIVKVHKGFLKYKLDGLYKVVK